jgi:predicted nuclease of predicted toxin-antitoxin system
MKTLLLDENLPRRLVQYFSNEFSVSTVSDLGWQSKENGDLLSSMKEKGLQFLITADRNLQFQQNLDSFSVRIVLIRSINTRLKTMASKVGEIEQAITAAASDQKVIEVDLR